jgi:hypothetical protein
MALSQVLGDIATILFWHAIWLNKATEKINRLANKLNSGVIENFSSHNSIVDCNCTLTSPLK